MHRVVEERLPEVEELCRRHHVSKLELFGSAAMSAFDPAKSDLDFLVEFSSDAALPWMGEYFELKKDLESLFARPVDLVMPGSITNPYYRQGVAATRRVVYAQ